MSGIALITGGSRGIGAATAHRLAAQGFALCLNYRINIEVAEALAAQLRNKGARVLLVQADIAVESEVHSLFQTIDAQLGPITALVNNAAILMKQSVVKDLDADRIKRIFNTNVVGSFLCCKEAVLRMSTSSGGRGGAIVNVSSVAARTGSPNEYVDYAASKAAIDALTRGLSVEVANEGIRVNAVRPGFIYTDMHADGGEPNRVERLKSRIPLQRGGTPEEVANAIAWLLSDESSYVTGTTVDIAGGV